MVLQLTTYSLISFGPPAGQVESYEVSKQDGMHGQEPESVNCLDHWLCFSLLFKFFQCGTLALGRNSDSIFALLPVFRSLSILHSNR